jgi:glyoxylase-like metal-dependent hydrolase (beta-lactamase superfamily II)
LSESGASPASLPTDTYFIKQKDMFVSGEAVQLLHVPAAHTDGDTIVFFRRSDVISAGDAFTPDRYPMIDLARGGSIEGMLAGINYILELAVPDINEEGGTMIVPGHGRLCDESDVSDYRDMVTIVRDRVADMVKKKMTLEQVKAAKPTRDYDGVYATPEHTGDTFVEAVYRSLTSQAGARPR